MPRISTPYVPDQPVDDAAANRTALLLTRITGWLIVLAALAAATGLVAALRLEPDNYNAWLGAARLQASAFGDRAGAVTTLRRAYLASGQRRQVRTELNAAERALGLPVTP